MSRPSVASCPEPVALPVIFIPGIMGSRLKNGKGKTVWDPTASKMAGLGLAAASARKKRDLLVGGKKQYFNPNFLSVVLGEANDDLSIEAIKRGWGGVLWGFYGDAYNWLRLQTLVLHPNEKQVPKCGQIFLETWAYPYNWTNDNKASATGQGKSSGVGSDVGLRKVVETAVSETAEKYKNRGIRILKPILITHEL